MLGFAGYDVGNCAFSRCGDYRVYGWEEAVVLVMFAILLVVRVLFLIGERAILLRLITYYQRVAVRQAPHSAYKGSPLILAGDELVGGESAVKTSIDFKNGVRQLLGGDTAMSTRLLLVSVFVQVTFWFSEMKISIAQSRTEFDQNLGV
jgi:hypothetical protein